MTLSNNMKGNTNMEGKTYITIMKEALKKRIVDEDRKPDLSMKDWKFILECLVTLDNIYEAMDDINAEHFKEKCVINFEVLGDVTGHEIL